MSLQQYLPLAVLKLFRFFVEVGNCYSIVATVLTACGIETGLMVDYDSSIKNVATVLTACGIETFIYLLSY